MIAVIFEVVPTDSGKDEYLAIADQLRADLADQPGLISIERFQSLSDPKRVLSLSFWEDEQSVQAWREHKPHHFAQQQGRQRLFKDYRIRVASVIRDYSMADRSEAPQA